MDSDAAWQSVPNVATLAKAKLTVAKERQGKLLENGEIEVKKVPGACNVADAVTKSVPAMSLEAHFNAMGFQLASLHLDPLQGRLKGVSRPRVRNALTKED